MFCGGWINFGNGIRWTTNVTVWFAGRLLLATKSRWRAEQGVTVPCDLAVPRSIATQSR